MRFFTMALVCSLLFMQPVFAKQITKIDAQSESLIEQGEYTNSDGNVIHSPAHTKSGKAPEGATAKCRDGSYSFSQHRRGTCSRHGGVAEWLN